MSGATPKNQNHMKTILILIAAVLFTIGMAMATGVDQNPIQAVYCVVLVAGALVCFRIADAKRSESDNKSQTTRKVYDYQLGTFRDVA